MQRRCRCVCGRTPRLPMHHRHRRPPSAPPRVRRASRRERRSPPPACPNNPWAWVDRPGFAMGPGAEDSVQTPGTHRRTPPRASMPPRRAYAAMRARRLTLGAHSASRERVSAAPPAIRTMTLPSREAHGRSSAPPQPSHKSKAVKNLPLSLHEACVERSLRATQRSTPIPR
eukprot:186136-Chlamydomonas_euryale.AAC.3